MDSDPDLRVIAFAFAPGDYVTVSYLDMKKKGRVLLCMWSRAGCRYQVEYNNDGELKCAEFYQDEIEPS